jgi:homoserine kinase
LRLWFEEGNCRRKQKEREKQKETKRNKTKTEKTNPVVTSFVRSRVRSLKKRNFEFRLKSNKDARTGRGLRFGTFGQKKLHKTQTLFDCNHLP